MVKVVDEMRLRSIGHLPRLDSALEEHTRPNAALKSVMQALDGLTYAEAEDVLQHAVMAAKLSARVGAGQSDEGMPDQALINLGRRLLAVTGTFHRGAAAEASADPRQEPKEG